MARNEHTDPKITAARDAGFVGQTELGLILQLSSRRVGQLLDGVGLKSGRLGTAYAQSLGAASEALTGRSEKDGEYMYCLWRPEVVVPLLRAIL